MATRSYACEILDGGGTWTDITNRCMGIRTTNIGLSERRKAYADVGRFEVAAWNQDRSLTPDSGPTTINLVNANRRIRMRYTLPSYGKILRVIHSGPYGLGGTTSITASGSTDSIGSSLDRRIGQTLLVTTGQLSQITVKHSTNIGTPTGTVTLEVWTADPNVVGVGQPVASTTYTPTVSATNTIPIANGPALAAGKVWITWKSTGAQTGTNSWQLQCSATSTYPDGNESNYDNTTNVYTDAPARDVECSITTALIDNFVGQQQSTAIAVNDVFNFSFRARAQFDQIYNSVAVRVVTDAEGGAFTTLNLTNKWKTYSISFTASVVGTLVGARVIPQFVGDGVNSQVLEFDDFSLTKNGGANLLTNPGLETGAVSPWASSNVGAPVNATNTLSVIDDYIIRLNGRIYNVVVSPFARGGDLRCVLQCTDLVQDLMLYPVPVAVQRNKRGDELINAAWSLLPHSNVFTTLPGKLTDVGQQVFPVAYDSYNAKSQILQAFQDVALSEGPLLSYTYLDLDGTLRWRARDFMPLTILSAPYLTLVGKDVTETGALPFEFMPTQSKDSEISEVVFTWRPRKSVASVVLASAQSSINIPPRNADGSPGVREESLYFRDPATQIPCAGENVITPLVATTDYRIFEQPDGTGVEYTNLPSIAVKVTSVEATKINVRFENTATGPLQCTKLQCRGDAIVTYDTKEATKRHSDVTQLLVPPKPYTKDLPFNDSENFVEACENYIIGFFGRPFLEAPQVSFDNRADLGGTDLLGIELMQTVALSDPQAGWSSAVRHLVIGVSFEIHTDASEILFTKVIYRTIRLDTQTYWILGDATYGILGTTTRLFV
jgi:hypothetical protein